MIIVVQVVSGIANISYFALGVSYLDDNTTKKHVSGLIGFLISVKIFGILIGCMLAWICLRWVFLERKCMIIYNYLQFSRGKVINLYE